MKICGVYKITCGPTGKVYVGSSVDVKSRWKGHRSSLNRNCHGNVHLQGAWNKYGSSAFQFEVLEITSPDLRIEVETVWINKLHAADRSFGYNLVRSPSDCRTVSDETRLKQQNAWTEERRLRLADMNRARIFTPEMRASCGRQHTAEDRLRISATLKGRTINAEQRARLSAAMQGHIISSETRAKIGQANARQGFIITDPNGNEYQVTNLTAFCRAYGLNAPNMCNVAKGKRPHNFGWRCRYAKEGD